MNALLAWFNKVRSNPIFVSVVSAFVGALGKELYTAFTTGTFDWSLKSFEAMGAAALSTAFIAIYHLYLQPSSSGQPAESNVKIPVYNPAKDPRIAPVILFAALILAHSASAQAPATGNGFSAASGPCGLYTAKQWTVCNFTAEGFDFLDFGAQKQHHVFVLNNNLIAPGVFSAYTGGIGIQPDLTALFKATNVAPGSLQIGFDVSGGIATVPTGPSVPSWLAGGNLAWNLTPNLTWNTVQAHYGAVGSQQFAEISTTIEWAFNPSEAKVATAQAKRMARAQRLITQGR